MVDSEDLAMLADWVLLGGNPDPVTDAAARAVALIDTARRKAEESELARIKTAERKAKVLGFRPMLTRVRATLARGGYRWGSLELGCREYVTGWLSADGVVLDPVGLDAATIAKDLRGAGFTAQVEYDALTQTADPLNSPRVLVTRYDAPEKRDAAKAGA